MTTKILCNKERLLWIAKYKNINNYKCYIGQLQLDCIYVILKYMGDKYL